MLKIAILGGRPADHTILPKQEKEVWKELKRVLKEDLKSLSGLFPYAEFLFPLYSKFDMEVLREVKSYGRPITFYVPSEDWGLSRLPKHQITLIKNVDAKRIIVPNNIERINKMLEEADFVYTIRNTEGIDYFDDIISTKKVYLFSEEKMNFKTEEEAQEYYEKTLNRNSNLDNNKKKVLIESYFS